ncbi:MAG: TfoX/Sxy family DNA transformation protein [Pseudobdellovibrionaceae bacterium]
MPSRPKMFREPTTKEKKAKTDQLSSLANIGPVMERTLADVGINTVRDFEKVGWQGALKRLVLVHPRFAHTIYAEVLIGALKDLPWHKVSSADKKAAQRLCKALRGK